MFTEGFNRRKVVIMTWQLLHMTHSHIVISTLEGTYCTLCRYPHLGGACTTKSYLAPPAALWWTKLLTKNCCLSSPSLALSLSLSVSPANSDRPVIHYDWQIESHLPEEKNNQKNNHLWLGVRLQTTTRPAAAASSLLRKSDFQVSGSSTSGCNQEATTEPHLVVDDGDPQAAHSTLLWYLIACTSRT